MDNRYRVVISNKNLYREIDLAPDLERLTFGTGEECDIRLRKDLFFGKVEIVFFKNNGQWAIQCSDNLYLSLGDVIKHATCNLDHGDELVVKYQESDNDVFSVSFMIDFDYQQKDYRRKISLYGINSLTIGGSSDCDIRVKGDFIGNDSFALQRKNNHWEVIDRGTKYGVYVNGKKIVKTAQLENFDFVSIVGESFYYKNEILYASTNVEVSDKVGYQDTGENSTVFVYPKFNRNTRVQYNIPEIELEVQQPITKPSEPKKNLVLILIPALVMLALTIVLRGIIGGGGTFVIYSAVSMTLGVIMSTVTYIQEKKTYKKDYAERIEQYNLYIENKKKEIVSAREHEVRARNLIYESLDNSIREAFDFGRRLFEKSPEDKDFLQVFVGKGKVESANEVKFTKQEFVDLSDPISQIPEQLAQEYRYVDPVPIISDFNASCGIGVVAKREILHQVLRNMTMDIAIRHFYGDVRFVYILNESEMSEFSWVRWLRNVVNQQLDIRNIVYDDNSTNTVLENLYIILSERDSQRQNAESDTHYDDHYVVFVTDSTAIKKHPVSKYIKKSKNYGFTFVFFEEHEENLPQGCTEILRVSNEDTGTIIQSIDGDMVSEFKYPKVSRDTAHDIALKLGAVVVDEVNLESQLTKNISIFELLQIFTIEDLKLDQRWQNSAVYRSMAAPLGVKNKNQVVYLDISDRSNAHGPHGLVAGTTGSGKSEILQTYILSMASLYHPYEVGFVIIDFKGGGMANQFKNLPHLVGTITNIDGHEIKRSLLSIKAELVKRQELFSQNGVNHLNDYIRLYKANKVTEPLPHLIIIVDEFAELKAEHPDFMKELISAARIGRTLGVHLILATQKPAGVVDAQIWSNSKFKLCLKVQTKEDSNEVLKNPLAAEIVEPGRAYFQVGNNEIFDLFQSAYSGGNTPTGDEINEKIYSIYELNLWGIKTLKYTNKKVTSEENSRTQLQTIVDYIYNHCESNKIKSLPGICLPALNDYIHTDELAYDVTATTGKSVPIGIYDDPQQQHQGEVLVDVQKDNIYIVGSAQTGKTIMLQTILYGLIRKYSPEEVNLYLIDCGSMVLKIFESSAHVGGVVLPNEEEKCINLFKLLKSTVAIRKNRFSEKGVGNYGAYLEAGYKDLPMMVVAIDNMAAFKEYFPNLSDEVSSLTREAQGVGISFIVTAAASNALNYRTQANFNKKLVLNCNDPTEYSNVFGHCKETPKDVPGRGLFVHDKRILEYQVAMFGHSTKEVERSQELREYIALRNQDFTTKAVPIPMVPENLSLSDMMSSRPDKFRSKGIIPIGMDYSTVDLTSINMNTTGSLTLAGESVSKDTFLANTLMTIAKTVIFHNIEAVIVDDKAGSLKQVSDYGFVKHYTNDAVEGLNLVADYCEEVATRHSDDQHDNFYLLVLNSADVFRRICADKNESKRLAETIKVANEANAYIILASADNQPVGFNAPDVLKAVKDERQGILFAPLLEAKLYDVSGRIKEEISFDNTMGYRFSGNTYSKIKIFD